MFIIIREQYNRRVSRVSEKKVSTYFGKLAEITARKNTKKEGRDQDEGEPTIAAIQSGKV